MTSNLPDTNDAAKTSFPLVSIVTPVYNAEKYIAECIESVLAQDYPNIEYIVINDGSVDNTANIIKQYEPKIIYLEQSNQGQSKSLNRGWCLSKGKYLTYLSADDKILPTAISKLVQLLENNKNAVVSFSDCNIINRNGHITHKSAGRPFNYAQLLVNQEVYIGPSPLFTRSLYNIIGGWQEHLRLAPDREFWLRAAAYGEFLMHPECLTLYRIHDKSTSIKLSDLKAAEEYVSVIHNLEKNNIIPEQYRPLIPQALANAYVFSARIHLRAGRVNEAKKQLLCAKTINPELNLIKTYCFLFKYICGRALRYIHMLINDVLAIKDK